MNKVSLSEVKTYLGLDGGYCDEVLTVFLNTAEQICEKVLRAPLSEETPPVVNAAILFIVWQFYYNRNNSEFNAASVENTVAVMLSDFRKMEF